MCKKVYNKFVTIKYEYKIIFSNNIFTEIIFPIIVYLMFIANLLIIIEYNKINKKINQLFEKTPKQTQINSINDTMLYLLNKL